MSKHNHTCSPLNRRLLFAKVIPVVFSWVFATKSQTLICRGDPECIRGCLRLNRRQLFVEVIPIVSGFCFVLRFINTVKHRAHVFRSSKTRPSVVCTCCALRSALSVLRDLRSTLWCVVVPCSCKTTVLWLFQSVCGVSCVSVC